ncbi:hypothetical protein ACM01_35640 [Streptomyces viridochromogenes]|uniref:Uncharacterized protein n=1 Tax=Streptomyces viridochromogenes TaxID=1938 RepID=A0A0J7Z1Q5_STRVR|nr:hypothetical protein [Streptomyces viridochromogenes]KMS69263.1 hypothetical protein ACM01_35640 [Streptomyces viridochromogenes]KOG09921.1 hypothetical protein ADK35_39015 [Streptomyces viridochromogenes]KOG21367.1 hypothetical protein ADK36_15210 [Streptomyces viridochromogenes]
MTTALSATAAPAARTPRGPRGLVWAVLRVHRTALVFGGLALAVATACLIWMYAIADDARRGNVPCAEPAHDGFPSCASVEAITVDNTYADGIDLLTAALSYVIFPVAAWAGGALIARDLESGTARLAWTQSVTPARWLAAKLAVPAVLLTAATGTVALLGVWARQDDDPNLVGDWYYPDVFISTGPTAVAYPLAGLALGALTGLLLRRALPATGAGFAAALVLYNVLERTRENLWPTVTRTEAGGFELPRSAWQMSWDGPTRATRAMYHPQSHFWPLQYVETGILLAVAAAATLTAFAVLRRRTP